MRYGTCETSFTRIVQGADLEARRGRLLTLTAPVDGTVQQLAIQARLTHVSHDAISDEKKGLIYSTRAKLQRGSESLRER